MQNKLLIALVVCGFLWGEGVYAKYHSSVNETSYGYSVYDDGNTIVFNVLDENGKVVKTKRKRKKISNPNTMTSSKVQVYRKQWSQPMEFSDVQKQIKFLNKRNDFNVDDPLSDKFKNFNEKNWSDYVNKYVRKAMADFKRLDQNEDFDDMLKMNSMPDDADWNDVVNTLSNPKVVGAISNSVSKLDAKKWRKILRDCVKRKMKRDALSKDEAVRACAIDNVFDVHRDYLKNLEQTDPEFYRYLYAD